MLDAYGWTDLQSTCEFLLDYEEEEEEEEEDDEEEGPRRRKKPWRYRWPDEIGGGRGSGTRFVLNRERAEQERLAGAGEPAKKAAKGSGRKMPKGRAPGDLRRAILASTERT